MAPNDAPSQAANPKPGSKPDPNQDLKSLSMPDLQAKLGSSPDGLTQAEAQKRLNQYGPNQIEEKKTNEILKLLNYFWGPIPWMIEVAVILSAIDRHWPDFAIILLLLLANAVVGFWEEHQAGNAIAALKATLAIKARVKRDGKWINPAARELVPGDVIRVRLGDIVPADARLLDGDPVEVDQSALTGESLPAKMARSKEHSSTRVGRRTLTATTRPSGKRALCTCATEAEARGTGANSAKISRSGRCKFLRRCAPRGQRGRGPRHPAGARARV